MMFSGGGWSSKRQRPEGRGVYRHREGPSTAKTSGVSQIWRGMSGDSGVLMPGTAFGSALLRKHSCELPRGRLQIAEPTSGRATCTTQWAAAPLYGVETPVAFCMAVSKALAPDPHLVMTCRA